MTELTLMLINNDISKNNEQNTEKCSLEEKQNEITISQKENDCCL